MTKNAILSKLPIAAVGCIAFVMTAGADVWNRKTIVNFPEAVEVPGNVTLPAGTYVMKLADSSSNRHIVQFFSERENKVYATVLAIPKYRMDPADDTIITFYETPKGTPSFIRTWYYPGDTVGQEFVYSKERREYIASLMNTRPAETVAVAQVTTPEPVAVTEPVVEERSTTVVESGEVAAVATPPAATADSIDDQSAATAVAEPAVTDDAQAAPQAQPAEPVADALPQTATSAPAMGLLALGFLGSALMLRAARRV